MMPSIHYMYNGILRNKHSYTNDLRNDASCAPWNFIKHLSKNSLTLREFYKNNATFKFNLEIRRSVFP